MPESLNDRKLPRWKHHDYSGNAWYHIVICTKDRMHFFGHIVGTMMILSSHGKIADQHWREIPKFHPHAMLDEFIVMPNHIHGIVGVGNVGKTLTFSLPTAPSDHHLPFEQRRNVRQHQRLPIIIGGYKSGVSRLIHELPFSQDFRWQTSYYDHIIRNEESFYTIKQYIVDNPKDWKNDGCDICH